MTTCKPAGEFGSRLYSARKAAGLTHAKVADLVGVRRNTVARWERGELLPSPHRQAAILAQLAKAAETPSPPTT